jgi:histidine triad (HIT) family protein
MPNCVFCRIIDRTIPANVLFEDDLILAFTDIRPQAPKHILIIPKKHFASLNEVPDDTSGLLGRLLVEARRIAAAEGLAASGFRLVVNTGPDSGQDVPHLHVHLLGGRKMAWPPG